MLFVERIGKPRVVIGVRTLFQCRTEGEARLLPFAVLHQRLAQRAPQQRAVTDGFDLLTQHFLDLLWVIGFQARDHHDQTIVVLALETVEEDLLGGVMIVTFNQMFSHRYLQWNLLTRFTALILPPGFQTVAAQVSARLIHQANPRQTLKLVTMFIVAHLGLRHRWNDVQQ